MFGKKFWKQFAIALALFLLGYLTFNSKLFAQTNRAFGIMEENSEGKIAIMRITPKNMGHP